MDGSATTASFKQFHVDQIAADMKESICRVSDGPFDAQENVNIPTVSYEVSSPALHPAPCSCSGIEGELLLPLDAAVLLVQTSLKSTRPCMLNNTRPSMCCAVPNLLLYYASSLHHAHPVASHRHMHDPLACQTCLNPAAVWSVRIAFWNIQVILQLS